MGIDISKLEGLMKTLATVSDVENKNGKIEGEKEVSIFKGFADSALASGQVTEDEYKKVFGLETSAAKPAAQQTEAVTTNPLSRKEKRAANKEAEGREEHVIRKLQTVIDNGEDVVSGLQEALGKLADTPEYKDLQALVKYISDNVNAQLKANEENSDKKEVIDDLEKNIKKKLSIGKKDKFAKEVLGLLVNNAEKKQMRVEYDEVKSAFSKEIGNGNKSYDEAFDAVKEQYKDKDSYYKKALSQLENNYVKKLKDEKAIDALNKVNIIQDEDVSRRQVRKAANTILEKDDIKISKRKLREKVTGDESRVHTALGNRVRAINVENAKSQSKEQILEAIGGKKDLFDALVSAGLINDNGDGKYDLSVLSDIIRNEVGKDNYLDKTVKKLKPISEKLGTFSQLKLETSLNDLSDKEAKELIELCGFEIQGKNWGKIVLKTVLGGIFGAVSAGGAEAARKSQDISYYKKDSFQQYLHIDTKDLDNYKYAVIIDGKEIPVKTPAINVSIPEGASNAAQVVIDIATNVENVQDILFNGGKFILSNAMRGAIIGSALGFLDGILADDTMEIPITDLTFDCTDIATYIKKVEMKNPEWSDVLTAIAITFSDNEGNWNCQEYKDFLAKAAGNDILNKKELVAALQEKRKELEEKPEQGLPTTPVQEATSEEKCAATIDDKYTDTTFTYTRQGGDTWKEIVKAFYPCLEEEFGMFGKDGAIRRLKKALSYNEDGTFNKETYKALLDGGDLPKTMKLPAQIDGCDRVDNAQVKKVKVHGNGKAKIQAVGNGSGYYTYTAEDGCDGQTATGSSKQEALANLKAKTGKTYTNEQDLLK